MAEARRRRAVLLLLAGALGLAVVGCASDYRYVNNSQEKAFFRLPADVEVFRVRTEEPTDRPVPLDLSPTEPWVVVFDAAEEPSVDHAGLAAPTDPVGRAVILPVGFETGEQLSVKAARSQLAGGEDPLDLRQLRRGRGRDRQLRVDQRGPARRQPCRLQREGGRDHVDDPRPDLAHRHRRPEGLLLRSEVRVELLQGQP